MKRLLLPYLFTSVALLNAETTITEGNLTFTFPEGWGVTSSGDIGGPTPHSFWNDGHAVKVRSQEGFYSYSLNALIGSNFSDPLISPTHTLSGGELTYYLDVIIDDIFNNSLSHDPSPHPTNFTYLNNENGLIVRKFDGSKRNYMQDATDYRYLIYLFLDDNSAVSWVVNVDTRASNEATSADIQQLDLVAQNATTTQPKQEYEPVVTYTEEEYNAVVTQRDARPTQADYDAIVADRNSRPTQAAYDSVVAERDAKLTLDEVKDLRAGSTMIAVEDGAATLSMDIEKSSDLSNWTFDRTTTVDIPIEDGIDTKFFRFKMADPDTTVTVTVSEDTIAGRQIGVFYFNGVEKAVLEFEKDTTYTFIQNDSSNATYASIHHPLMFSTGNDGEHNDHGHYMSGIVYKLDGVIKTMAEYVNEFVDASDRRIEWTVPSNAPATLYYWCHFHTGQGAAMTVTD